MLLSLCYKSHDLPSEAEGKSLMCNVTYQPGCVGVGVTHCHNTSKTHSPGLHWSRPDQTALAVCSQRSSQTGRSCTHTHTHTHVHTPIHPYTRPHTAAHQPGVVPGQVLQLVPGRATETTQTTIFLKPLSGYNILWGIYFIRKHDSLSLGSQLFQSVRVWGVCVCGGGGGHSLSLLSVHIKVCIIILSLFIVCCLQKQHHHGNRQICTRQLTESVSPRLIEPSPPAHSSITGGSAHSCSLSACWVT